MAKALSKEKIDKYDKAILKGIDKEMKDKKSKLSEDEKKEMKAYAIKKVLKIKKYARN